MTGFTAFPLRRALACTVILAGLGLAAASGATTTAPLACDITVDQTGRMVHFQGRVQATTPLSGTYSLTLSGGGTNLRQGGAFTAAAGEIVTLGQANLSGTPERYDVDMTLNVGGTIYNCAPNL